MLSILFTTQILADDQGHCLGHQNSATDATPNDIEMMSEATDHINAIMTDSDGASEDGAEEVRRFELFRFEKDYNAKNILSYGIKVNTPSCTIAHKTTGAPDFSNYWIMGEERGQAQKMTKSDLKKLGPIVLSHDEHTVNFKMNAFADVPIKKKEITVEAKIVDGKCKVTGSVQLDNGHRVDLSKIFAKISTFAGIPTGVDYLDVEGLDRTTGARINVRFDQ